MGDRKLETVAKEVFLSIPPDVRTGVFIDVFTPCDWKCVAYTDIQRTELTVHIKGDRLGLYDTNGKALLANGKDE